MKRLTVNEAATYFGITKEAIYNRIRRGSIKTVTQNNEKYIVLEEDNSTNNKKTEIKQKQAPKVNGKTAQAPDERYVNLLVSQIKELRDSNNELNKDKKKLIQEKETLLVEQRDMIERVYKERDEQLKAILTLANRTLLANPNTSCETPIEAEFEANIQKDIEIDEDSDWYRLKTLLKEKGYSKKKKKKIIQEAKESIGESEDITEEDGEIYIKGDKDLNEIIGG